MEKKKLSWAHFKQYIPLYFMLLPGAVYLFINNYIPMAGIVVAFKTYKVNSGIFGSPWTGLKNFEFLFSSNEAAVIIRNTLLYNVAFIIVNMVVGIALAIFITDVTHKSMKKFYQSSILLPFLISIVVVSYIVFALLSHENGMMNNSILPLFGQEPVQWYNDTTWWPLILIIPNCWKGVGYGTLIYIAAIAGIDTSFYEAAELAKKAAVKELWLTHYSPSLTRPEEYMRDVRKIFPAAVAARDGRSADLMFEEA